MRTSAHGWRLLSGSKAISILRPATQISMFGREAPRASTCCCSLPSGRASFSGPLRLARVVFQSALAHALGLVEPQLGRRRRALVAQPVVLEPPLGQTARLRLSRPRVRPMVGRANSFPLVVLVRLRNIRHVGGLHRQEHDVVDGVGPP
ncbi:unnamed protein product [Prorocentrum cordatum]|uniref:Uncharacterized protein n=1 Tax=Prorocentrum cordatum TaxID=2364126 RepID=A0ABN9QMF1_9DINO|nr:unnamed protein product [Polarella glacialis]